MPTYDYTFKVLLLGDPASGKEELVKNFISGFLFSTTVPGAEIYIKTIHSQGKGCKLQIWDMGRGERFKFFFPTYCSGSSGAIIMYDITNSETLKNLPEWVQIVREKNGNIPIILVGNNIDLEKSREVPREEGRKLTKFVKLHGDFYSKLNLSSYIEISTKTGQNIEKLFEVVTELMIKYVMNEK